MILFEYSKRCLGTLIYPHESFHSLNLFDWNLTVSFPPTLPLSLPPFRLFSGAMPVLERSIGLDRSWHKLPVSE